MPRLLARSLTAILSLSLLAATPTAALAKPTTPVTDSRTDARTAARADMLARRTADTRSVIEQHFTALAAGDAKAVRALWTRDARVVSIDAAGTPKTQKLAPALTRWLSHHDDLQWEIVTIAPITDSDFEVTARVTWNGAVFDDTLRVVKNGRRMLIRHKSSRPHVAAETKAKPPSSPY
ncbi:MAG TPA: nuclear transport factor 2 family protein [Kofleriaceae bacterium]|nr:nuclear transport factor 2 family protein [Kofleriaceae bacterium]